MELCPASLEIAERYKLLIGGITPRPIAAVSTISPTGAPNLAPFSFFAGVGSNPMTVLFCPANDANGSEKDTLRNCKPAAEGGTGEFVVNVVSESLIRRVVAAAEPLPPDRSEFEFASLGCTPAFAVKPPRLAESPVCFECRTLQVIRTGRDVPSAGNIVLGEVVHVYVADEVADGRLHLNADRIAAIGRMGGPEYCTTRARLALPMGSASLAAPEPFGRATGHS